MCEHQPPGIATVVACHRAACMARQFGGADDETVNDAASAPALSHLAPGNRGIIKGCLANDGQDTLRERGNVQKQLIHGELARGQSF